MCVRPDPITFLHARPQRVAPPRDIPRPPGSRSVLLHPHEITPPRGGCMSRLQGTRWCEHPFPASVSKAPLPHPVFLPAISGAPGPGDNGQSQACARLSRRPHGPRLTPPPTQPGHPRGTGRPGLRAWASWPRPHVAASSTG